MSMEGLNNKMEEEQRLNEDLENYFANTIIPQLFVDANLILRKFTPPAMKQFTLTKADINRDFHDLINNIRYPTIIENIKEVISTGEILEKEVQTTDKRWYQMNILPYFVRKENKTNGVIITFVDITKRLSTLKELEKLNSEHDILMYTLSHDIKQPLSTIFLLADELVEAFKNGDSESFNKWIAILNSSSQNMRALLDDFTEKVHIQPEVPTEEERVNIEHICHDVILSLRDDIYSNGVKITTEFNTSEITFSRRNIRSIMYNLLNNAIKYKDPERPLEIFVKTEKIEEYVRLIVKDNGIGIARKHHKEIFKKYMRINDTLEGTGIGLYILRRMLEDKGGKIEVKSTLGKGSTFMLYFKSND